MTRVADTERTITGAAALGVVALMLPAVVVAAIHLSSAVSFARGGAFGRSGILPSIAPLSHTAWLAAIAAVTLRGASDTAIKR